MIKWDLFIDHCRSDLKNNLKLCTEAQQHLFKQMYAKGNLDMTIEDCVNQMETEKLEQAMRQVERTLGKGVQLKMFNL